MHKPMIALLFLTAVACKKQEIPAEVPISVATESGHQPAMIPAEMQGQLPADHPPIAPVLNAQGLPAPATSAQLLLNFVPPPTWEEKPARPMLLKVWAVEDAEVTLSALPPGIPLSANVQRWCGQFDLEGGKPCAEAVKQSTLPGAALPTQLVELAGTFKGSSMAGPATTPRTGWQMLAAVMETPAKTYFVKLTGPKAVVAKHREMLLKAVAAAK